MLDKIVHALDTAGLWVAAHPKLSLAIYTVSLVGVAVVF